MRATTVLDRLLRSLLAFLASSLHAGIVQCIVGFQYTLIRDKLLK